MAAWSLVTLSLAQLSKRRYPNYSLFVRQSSCSTKDKPVLRNQRLQYCMIMCRVGNILAAVVRMLDFATILVAWRTRTCVITQDLDRSVLHPTV
jgi:hypothetical protein